MANGSSLNSLCCFQGSFNIMIITLYHCWLGSQTAEDQPTFNADEILRNN